MEKKVDDKIVIGVIDYCDGESLVEFKSSPAKKPEPEIEEMVKGREAQMRNYLKLCPDAKYAVIVDRTGKTISKVERQDT